MRRDRTPPHPPTAVAPNPRQRGFAFLLILSLIVVAAVVVGTALTRASANTALTEFQLEAYRRHHEMLGVRDYVRSWLNQPRNDLAQLARFAQSREPVHRLVLDNTIVVLIYVQDGQGTVLRNLANIVSTETRRWLVELLARLPRDRPDLTRRSGPATVSLLAAPDEVLDALAVYDPKVSGALREARDRGLSDVSEFLAHMTRSGVETMVAQALTQSITFEPSLWRLNVEVVHPDRVNRYTLLGEKHANMPVLHEWRPVADAEAERLFGITLTPPPGGAPRP